MTTPPVLARRFETPGPLVPGHYVDAMGPLPDARPGIAITGQHNACFADRGDVHAADIGPAALADRCTCCDSGGPAAIGEIRIGVPAHAGPLQVHRARHRLAAAHPGVAVDRCPGGGRQPGRRARVGWRSAEVLAGTHRLSPVLGIDCTSVLAPAARCLVTVGFTTSRPGDRRGSLRLTDGSGGITDAARAGTASRAAPSGAAARARRVTTSGTARAPTTRLPRARGSRASSRHPDPAGPWRSRSPGTPGTPTSSRRSVSPCRQARPTPAAVRSPGGPRRSPAWTSAATGVGAVTSWASSPSTRSPCSTTAPSPAIRMLVRAAPQLDARRRPHRRDRRRGSRSGRPRRRTRSPLGAGRRRVHGWVSPAPSRDVAWTKPPGRRRLGRHAWSRPPPRDRGRRTVTPSRRTTSAAVTGLDPTRDDDHRGSARRDTSGNLGAGSPWSSPARPRRPRRPPPPRPSPQRPRQRDRHTSPTVPPPTTTAPARAAPEVGVTARPDAGAGSTGVQGRGRAGTRPASASSSNAASTASGVPSTARLSGREDDVRRGRRAGRPLALAGQGPRDRRPPGRDLAGSGSAPAELRTRHDGPMASIEVSGPARRPLRRRC